MPRPVRGVHSLGRGRRRRARPATLLASIPTVDPEWELGVVQALVKPQTRGRVEHRSGEQHLPEDWQERVELAVAHVGAALLFHPEPVTSDAGDFHWLFEFDRADEPLARALVVVASVGLPGVWLRVGRLYVRDGVFWRRERGFKLNLKRATNVHLPRDVRRAVEPLLKR